MTNEQDLLELGLYYADICRTLVRGINGKKLADLSQSVCDAINQSTMWIPKSPTKMPSAIAGLWRRFRGRPSNGASGTQSLDFFTGRVTRTRSLLGG